MILDKNLKLCYIIFFLHFTVVIRWRSYRNGFDYAAWQPAVQGWQYRKIHMKEDELFGQLVLVNKMITQEQLDEALAIQQQSTEPRMLGNILLAKGYITSRQLRAILELQRRRIPKPATGSQEKKEDITFAFLAVRHKFATPAQVYQCMRQQLRCVKRGLFFRLSEVMLHQGIITQEQLEEITRRQQEKILVCSVCNSRFNTVGLPTGFLFRCKNCSNVLQVPAPK